MESRDLAIYFAGYLDAVGRQFSTDETLIAGTSRVLDEKLSIEEVLSSSEYKFMELENNKSEFESEVSSFLNADPSERLLFYLVEYFDWFEDFSQEYTCKRLILSGAYAPDKYLGYLLTCNEDVNILIYIHEKPKN